MFKTTINNEPKRTTTTMGEMNPLQIGRITSTYCKGHIIMRTASKYNFEIINLSHPKAGNCWNLKGNKTPIELEEAIKMMVAHIKTGNQRERKGSIF